MRRAPCPRCARPEGMPVVFGLPDEELFLWADRGEVALGGCVLRGDEPDYRCATCGHEWVDGPLPPWWPPADVEQMDPPEREVGGRELDRWHGRLVPIVDVVLAGPLPEAVDRLTELGPDPDRVLDEVFSALVVPSDRVLQAEAVHAAVAVCRALAAVTRVPATDTDELDSRFTALDTAVREYHRADQELAQRGHLDVMHLAEDDEEEEDDWVDAEERVRRLVASGDGEELPAVGEEWDDWLADTAAALFRTGSSAGWVRYVWSRLAASGLTAIETELDLARAQVRLVALEVLRHTLLARLDGDDVEEWRYRVDDPGISSFHLGVLVGLAGVEPGNAPGSVLEGETESAAFVELVRVEAGTLSSAMQREFGEAQVLALTWASRYAGARYPLAPEAVSEAVNHDLTPEKHMTYEWIDNGMVLY